MDEFGVVCQLATPDPICINYVGQKKTSTSVSHIAHIAITPHALLVFLLGWSACNISFICCYPLILVVGHYTIDF
jgi:hypothetical protein